MRLSVVVRTENSAGDLPELFENLARQDVAQVVVADAGSTDDTLAVAHRFGANVARAPGASGHDIWNAGFRLVTTPVAWYVAAESRLPVDGAMRILDAVELDECVGGRFRVQVEEPSWIARQAGHVMHSLREAFGALPATDSGFFFLTSTVRSLSGFRDTEFPGEDLLLRAKEIGRVTYIRTPITITGAAPEDDTPS